MVYLSVFCLSINWFVMSCASGISDGELQTLSTLSEILQKDTITNSENLHSRLLDKELEYFKHARTKAIKELSAASSKLHNEEESDNKPIGDGNKGTSGDAVVDKLNGQAQHTDVVRSSAVKGKFRSDHITLGKKHDQSFSSSYTAHSDYYNSDVSRSSDKDNKGPLADDDDDLFEQSEPIDTFSDVNFNRGAQWDFKTNIKLLNLDTGIVSENTVERHDELSRNAEGDDVRLRDQTLVKEIPFDGMSDSLEDEYQQNPIHNLYVFPMMPRKTISTIPELHRSIMPHAEFKQIEGPIESFGTNSVAGTSLYGAYASAHSGSYPYGGLGYNEEPFGLRVGGIGEMQG